MAESNIQLLTKQLLAQWSAAGVKDLPGGISLQDRASALAETMAQSGINSLADLKLGSKQITVDEGTDYSRVADVGYLSNKGQQLGFLGNVNENLKGKAEYLQPDNQVSWSAEGKGNVKYKAVQTADGGVAIIPEWNSSSDMKQIRDAAKLIGAVYGASALAGGGLFAGTAGEVLAGGEGLFAGEGLLAGGGATSVGGASLATLAGGSGLTAAEYAALYGTEGLTSAQIASLSGSLTAGGAALPATVSNGLLSTALPAANTVGGALTKGALSTLGGAAASTLLGNNNLSNIIQGSLTTAGSILQQQESKDAAIKAQAKIDAETAAAKLSSQFRPVGMTSRFGTSNFTYDPVTGQMVSAGYELSGEAKAQQDRFMALSNKGLTQAEQGQEQFAPLQTGAQTMFSLGNKYLAQSPEEVAQRYITNQMKLLTPGRELDLATLQNRLQQQGRSGISVAQGGNLGATTPELQALFNARAMQDATLAANAEEAGKRDITFGSGLLTQGAQTMGQYYGGQQAAYTPYTTAMGQVQNLEALGQQPFTLSSQLGQQSAQAGANVGRMGLTGAQLSTNLATSANATANPYAQALLAAGSPNSMAGQVINTAANSLFSGGGALDRYLYPSGNQFQVGQYANPGFWT
jgi:hypothetical protein